MPIIRSTEVEFTPGRVKNTMSRILLNSERGAVAVTLGELIMNPGAELPMRTHQVEEVYVITKGTATVFLGNDTYTLSPGDVILVPAGVPHAPANHSKDPMGFLFFYPTVEVK